MNTATFQEKLSKARVKKGEIFAQRRAVWAKAQQDAAAAKDAAPTAEAKDIAQKKLDVAVANLARFDDAAKESDDLAKKAKQQGETRIAAKAANLAKLQAEIEANKAKHDELVKESQAKQAEVRTKMQAIQEVLRGKNAPVEPPAPPAEENAAPVEPPL